MTVLQEITGTVTTVFNEMFPSNIFTEEDFLRLHLIIRQISQDRIKKRSILGKCGDQLYTLSLGIIRSLFSEDSDVVQSVELNTHKRQCIIDFIIDCILRGMQYEIVPEIHRYITDNHPHFQVDQILPNWNLATWQSEYRQIQYSKHQTGYKKYKKDSRGNGVITGIEQKRIFDSDGNYVSGHLPEIYIVPRRRTFSYKKFDFVDRDGNHIDRDMSENGWSYIPGSKGFSFADMSTHVLGPIVSEGTSHGINILNSSWSKLIKTTHLAGGEYNPKKKKDLWISKPVRKVEYNESTDILIVDDVNYDPLEWINSNFDLWFPEWRKWSRAIALSGDASFKWLEKFDSVAWVHTGSLTPEQNFGSQNICILPKNDWWGQTYVKWMIEDFVGEQFTGSSLVLEGHNPTFDFVKQLRTIHNRTIVIVHPMVGDDHNLTKPVTRQYLLNRYKQGKLMNAPFLQAWCLLNI
ncbi:MAG: hypothetical protein JKX76_00720 [Colwellia sp.]|nr:hypothetical protein [Colwellia sp.]